jgi:hypothetical protein
VVEAEEGFLETLLMSFLNEDVHLVALWRLFEGVREEGSQSSDEKPESEEKAWGAEEVVETSVGA